MTLRIIRPSWGDNDLVAAAALLVSSNVSDTTTALWSSATAYAVGDRVRLDSTHRIYQAAVANTNKQPDLFLTGTTPTWLDVQASNKYAMFDSVADTQSSQATVIDVTMQASRIGALYLGGLDAASVDITMSVGATTIYTRSVDLTLHNVASYYQYLTEPIIRGTEVALFDLPYYGGATLRVQINNAGGTAKCGTMLFGKFRTLGDVQWKPNIRRVSYSKLITDDFGNTKLIKRRNARLVSAQVFLDNVMLDEADRLMAEYDAVNLLWSMSGDDYNCLNVFGFKKDFDATLDSPAGTFFNLQVQGLT